MLRACFILFGALAASLGRWAPVQASEAQLAQALTQAIQPCWNPPVTSGAARISIALKTDGSLARLPEVLDPSTSAEATTFEQSAVRALLRCEPFAAASDLLAGRKTEIIVNFTLDGMDLTAPAEPALPGLHGVDIRLSAPDGLCRVDSERSDGEAQYNAFAAGLVEQNRALAFFLECELIEAIRVDVETFDYPKRWATLLAPTGPDGVPASNPGRSLAQAIADNEVLFEQMGAEDSSLNTALDEVVDRVARSEGVTLEGRLHRHIDTDERAAYVFTYYVAREGETVIPTMAIGAFSQIFGYSVTLNLYAHFDPEQADQLLTEAKRVMASLHEDSTRSE